MLTKLKTVFNKVFHHKYGFTVFVYLTAATLTGLACVWFMHGFEWVLERRLDFHSFGALTWLATPLLFLLSVELIRRAAPCAAGTGIPQAIFAARHLSPQNEKTLWPLVSPQTMTVKILALLIGLWAGASTGREGPTVHIATCVFIGIAVLFRRVTGFQFDLRSAVVAGGAAGLAAAFNTPLAGVTFAIEELTVDYFGAIKEYVLLAIIVAALAAKTLTGEYAYFGKLLFPPSVPIVPVLLIGLTGGLLGAMFSTAILAGQRKLAEFTVGRGRYAVPVVLALALLAVARWSSFDVLGPGNRAAQTLVEGHYGAWAVLFPLQKMLATLFTYWSGIAGGIFAPALSIGSALGADIGFGMGAPVAACALVGMAAFLSGTIQAPITAFVIIFEMTGHHYMLLPIMLAALVAVIVAKLVGARHLYQALSENYRSLLPQ